MRARAILTAIGLVATLAACGGSETPQVEGPAPTVQTPLAAVDSARDVATDLTQRNQDLEEQLRNPFERP